MRIHFFKYAKNDDNGHKHMDKQWSKEAKNKLVLISGYSPIFGCIEIALKIINLNYK